MYIFHFIQFHPQLSYKVDSNHSHKNAHDYSYFTIEWIEKNAIHLPFMGISHLNISSKQIEANTEPELPVLQRPLSGHL